MFRVIPTFLVLLAVGLVVIAPSAGCGGKKKVLTVKQRLEKAKKLPTPEARAAEFSKIATMRADAKDKKGAEETLGLALAEVPEEGQPLVCVPILIEIAETYVAVGQKPPARKAVETASKMAATVEDPKGKATLLAQIGVIQGSGEAGLGDARGAKKSLDEAAKLAAEDVAERFRGEALAVVAMGYADAGLATDATKMISTLEGLADGLTDLRPKAEAYAAAAAVRAAAGDKEAAGKLLEKASTAAKEITDFPANRAYALVAVAKALVANGDKATAKKLLADADKSAAKIADPEQNKAATKLVRALQGKLGA